MTSPPHTIIPNDYARLLFDTVSLLHPQLPWGAPSAVEVDRWRAPKTREDGGKVTLTWVREGEPIGATLYCRPFRAHSDRHSVVLTFSLDYATGTHVGNPPVIRFKLATPARLANYFVRYVTPWQTGAGIAAILVERREAERARASRAEQTATLLQLMHMKPSQDPRHAKMHNLDGTYSAMLIGRNRYERGAAYLALEVNERSVEFTIKLATHHAMRLAEFIGSDIIPATTLERLALDNETGEEEDA